jgi:hypothetical protein
MTARDAAEWVGFQLVWFACALGAAQGDGRLGVVAALAYVAAALAMRGWPRSVVIVVAVSTAAGVVAETAFVALGLIRHVATWPLAALAPAWIVALWFAFGVTIDSMARILGGRPIAVQAIVGFVFGPLAYWAGARLGTLTLGTPEAVALAATGLVWAVALPALILLHGRLSTSKPT